MNADRVLIFAPIHQYKEYCIDAWLEHVCTHFNYPNYHVFVVDNTEDKNWHRQFIGRYPNLTVTHYSPSNRKIGKRFQTIQETLAACQNKAITFANRIGASYIFSNECDNIIVQKDAIQALMIHNKLIVGSMYQHDFGEKRFHQIQTVDAPVFGTQTVSNKIRLMDYRETICMLDGGLHQVHGFGIGGVLLDMDIFNKYGIRFRSDFQGKGLSDSYLYYDAAARDIEAYIDTSIHNIHLNDSWGWKKAVEALKGREMV